MNTTPSSTHLCPIYIHYVLLRRSLISLCLTGIKSVKISIRPMSNCLKPTSRQLATSIDWHCYCTVYNVVHICNIVCLFLSFWVDVNLYWETFRKWQGYFRCYVVICIAFIYHRQDFYQIMFTPFDGEVHVAHLLSDSVHPVWRWSSCRSSFTRLCSPSLTVEFMSLIFSVFFVMCFNIYVFPVFCFVCWLMSFAFPFGRLLGVR